MKRTHLFLLYFVLGLTHTFAQKFQTENVFLITTDGFRWQEMFGGADSILIRNHAFTNNSIKTYKKYWSDSVEVRRKKLMPFFWNVIAQQGQLYGNRKYGNEVNVENNQWFSYPGYNEILTGFADARIKSNDKSENPNESVLEYLNKRKEFKGKVAAFTTWDVFPYILAEKRSKIYVNSGKSSAKNPNAKEQFLNELQDQIPMLSSDRYDYLTYHLAKEYIKKNHPRVFFLSFDETDEYAHEGRYDAYLNAANLVDKMIADLWAYIQSDSRYKDKTTLIITTDHGRGHTPIAKWKDHGSKTGDSDQIWLAVLGPDTPALGELKFRQTFYQSQIAQTIASFLNISYNPAHTTGFPIKLSRKNEVQTYRSSR